ncbi:hypothetical protein BC940DRAFT_305247 [Gongronella butleri]|nr:hypothetical protein BC940DRAFT_305247 [Gongronella butleri]
MTSFSLMLSCLDTTMYALFFLFFAPPAPATLFLCVCCTNSDVHNTYTPLFLTIHLFIASNSSLHAIIYSLVPCFLFLDHAIIIKNHAAAKFRRAK